VSWFENMVHWIKLKIKLDCEDCNRKSTTKLNKIKAPLQPIETPQEQWSHVHSDNAGPFPVSNSGNR
jgi:hypothetical protein